MGITVRTGTQLFYQSGGEKYLAKEIAAPARETLPHRLEPVLEVITDPLAVTRFDGGRLPPDLGISALSKTRHLLSIQTNRSENRLRISQILTTEEGWNTTEASNRWMMTPFPPNIIERPNHVRFTVDIPPTALHSLLLSTHDTPAENRAESLYYTAGRHLGDQVAAMYANSVLSVPISETETPFLVHLRGVEEVRGYIWALSTHIGIQFLAERNGNPPLGDKIPGAVLNNFGDIRRALPLRVRAFLTNNHQEISARIHAWMPQAIAEYAARAGVRVHPAELANIYGTKLEPTGSDTVRDYINYALVGGNIRGHRVSQNEAVGLSDHPMENHSGDPHIVFEIRRFGPLSSEMHPHEIKGGFGVVANRTALDVEATDQRPAITQSAASYIDLLRYPEIAHAKDLFATIEANGPSSGGRLEDNRPRFMSAKTAQELKTKIARSIISQTPDASIRNTLQAYQKSARENSVHATSDNRQRPTDGIDVKIENFLRGWQKLERSMLQRHDADPAHRGRTALLTETPSTIATSGGQNLNPLSHTLFDEQRAIIGRDLTRAERPPLDQTRTFIMKLAESPDEFSFQELRAAWPIGREHRPYFVIAEGKSQEIFYETEASRYESMSPVEFAKYLGEDKNLKEFEPESPVVLLVNLDGPETLTIPRLVAHYTGRTVFAATSRVGIVPSPDNRRSMITRYAVDESKFIGYWAKILPSDLENPDQAEMPDPISVRTVDHTRFSDANVVWRTIVDVDGRPSGRTTIQTPEAGWTHELQATTSSSNFVYGRLRPHANPGRLAAHDPLSATRLVPWVDSPERPYFVYAHGDQEYVDLSMRDGGIVTVNGSEFGKVLKRRPSISHLPPKTPLVLVACKTGGGVGNSNVAQLVANATGFTVHAPSHTTTDLLDVAGMGQWRTFHPMPADLLQDARHSAMPARLVTRPVVPSRPLPIPPTTNQGPPPTNPHHGPTPTSTRSPRPLPIPPTTNQGPPPTNPHHGPTPTSTRSPRP
ncbi:hypothetical protein ACWGJX_47380, partial [Streptomyces sp. NPDC054775]